MKSNYILAIDPGNEESAYCLIQKETYKPIEFGKISNHLMLIKLHELEYDKLIVEMIASYGMSVGQTVFETCVWLCNSMKAKDSNIRQALIDRFGEVGVKKAPGWFYGFKKDVWAAYAVGVTYLDKIKEQE